MILSSSARQLRRVNAAGGACVVAGKDDPKSSARLPVFLPDANHFFYVGETEGDDSSRGVYLAALDNPTPRKILADYSSVLYSPPVGGGRSHLLFLRQDTLMAQPFDDGKLEIVGDPFPVAPQATATLNPPQVAASVSNGTLVYVAGRSTLSQLTWFDRSGKELGKAGPLANQVGVVLSPDGNAVLLNRRESNGSFATWLYDLTRGSETRFLPSGPQLSTRVWFPDGSRVLFPMNGPATPGLYQKDTNGGGPAELVIPASGTESIIVGGTSIVPSAFSRDGRFLIYTVYNPKTRADISYLPWGGKPDWGKAVKFLATEANESQGQLSPDGKWIAYTSNDTGPDADEVYIRPFPAGSAVWKVSVSGGREPRWSEDGKQLYYLRGLTQERAILSSAAVELDGHGGLRTGTPQTLFEIHMRWVLSELNVFAYSSHPDGRYRAFQHCGAPDSIFRRKSRRDFRPNSIRPIGLAYNDVLWPHF